MPFDSHLAAAISTQFRNACVSRLDDEQNLNFERLLQKTLGVKQLRNVQLWTRIGRQQRNFINRNLGDYELGLRTFIADRFIQNIEPSFPLRRKPFFLPADDQTARKFLLYLNDNWIREYCTRIFIEGRFIYVEYATDSSTPINQEEIESDEFADVLED